MKIFSKKVVKKYAYNTIEYLTIPIYITYAQHKTIYKSSTVKHNNSKTKYKKIPKSKIFEMKKYINSSTITVGGEGLKKGTLPNRFRPRKQLGLTTRYLKPNTIRTIQIVRSRKLTHPKKSRSVHSLRDCRRTTKAI